MASLISQLNDLLAKERGEVEAVRDLVQELEKRDPDLTGAAQDVLGVSSWACAGLVHRIEQLGGTTTLNVDTVLPEVVADQRGPKAKLDIICAIQKEDQENVRSILERDDLDDDTKQFLNELLTAHMQAYQWCSGMLSQWKREAEV